MDFNYNTDKVVGKVEYFPNDRYGKIVVKGIYKNNSTFIKLSQEEAELVFPPYGKVFIYIINSLSLEFKTGSYIKFSTQVPQHKEGDLTHHDYSIDLYNDIEVLQPNIIYVENLIKGNNDTKYRLISNPLHIQKWTGYLYDEKGKILYEKIVNFEPTGVEAKKDTFIMGIQYDLDTDCNLIDKTPDFAYISKSFSPEFYKKDAIDVIDLSSKSQKMDWFKKTIKNLNEFDKNSLLKINTLINIIAMESNFDDSLLVSSRLKSINKIFNNITFSDEELKTILTKNSNIGNHLLSQILEEKDKYCKEIFDKIHNEANIEQGKINNSIAKQKEVNNLLYLQSKKLVKQNEELTSKKTELNSEFEILNKNKDLIYVTIKTLMDNYEQKVPKFSPNIKKLKNNLIINNFDYDYDHYSEESNLKLVDNDNFEYDFTSYSKIEDLKYILKNKFSFIPSISWCYALANYLGNSEVLNLSVEYDWLHYSDFVRHGLIRFIKECEEYPNKFYFLHFNNLNIIPLDCGFSPIYQVFSKEKPYFNGTKLELPENLFVTATLLTTKDDNSIGTPIIKKFQSLFKGIGNPEVSNPILLKNIKRQYKYEYNDKMKDLINNFPEKNSDSYYDY